MYEQMLLIRVFETEAERQYKAARIGGYCHLSSGQEATCVGVIDAMQDDDLLVTGYRSHGFALARGTSPEAVMAELFGRRDGCAHGRGGSMHLLDTERGYYGGWGIVGGQLPLATGLALALVRQGKPQAVDLRARRRRGEHGRLARVAQPRRALAACPSSSSSSTTSTGWGRRSSAPRPSPSCTSAPASYRMHGERVDGDDLEAVIETTSRLLERAREQREPAVLEAITYRYRGHSVADAGLAYRTKDEITEHQQRDPLLRTAARLREAGAGTDDLREIDERVEERVQAAVDFALESPEPDVDALAWAMYAQGSDEQFARMRPGSAFGEEELIFDGGLGK